MVTLHGQSKFIIASVVSCSDMNVHIHIRMTCMLCVGVA